MTDYIKSLSCSGLYAFNALDTAADKSFSADKAAAFSDFLQLGSAGSFSEGLAVQFIKDLAAGSVQPGGSILSPELCENLELQEQMSLELVKTALLNQSAETVDKNAVHSLKALEPHAVLSQLNQPHAVPDGLEFAVKTNAADEFGRMIFALIDELERKAGG